MSKQFRGKCIFCEGTGLSKEHIFADWIRDYIPRIHRRTAHLIDTAHISGRGRVLRRGLLDRPGDPHSQTLNKVCRACNNGWMSTLQSQVKPTLSKLIVGELPDLTRVDALCLIRWATMLVMVLDYAHPELSVTTQAQRAQFMEQLFPPTEFKIWMGRCDSNDFSGSWNHFGVRVAPALSARPADIRPTQLNSQCTTFIVGKIFFVVLNAAGIEFNINVSGFAIVNRMVTLYPPSESVWQYPDMLNLLEVDETSRYLFRIPADSCRRIWEINADTAMRYRKSLGNKQ